MGWLKKLVGFENNFTKNLLGDIGNDPSRLITGIDPFSTKAWNGVLGTDNEAMVNAFGSPGQQYYDRAQADGIDTGPAGQLHGVADVIAGIYGANGIAGIGGAGAGGAGTGAAAAGTGGVGGAGAAGAAGGGGLLSAIGGPSGALQLASGIGGALAANSGSKPSGSTSSMDPRVGGMLFGDGGADKGLLAGYRGMLDTPQNAGIKTFGNERDQYIGYQGSQDLGAIRNTALEQMRAGVPSPVTPGSVVQAPSQNNLDLKNSYNDFIYGSRGDNPYLTGAIGKGINQSKNAFSQMQDDSTRNLTENILPGLRSNSVLAGQYGGTRGALMEGRALGDFGREQQRAISQFGQNNTDAAVAAQAGAYETDSNRALAATQGLGSQQYGVAQQNAQMQQQANLFNNQAQQNTNALNVADRQAGVGNLSNLVSGAANAATNQDAYGINRAGQVNGLLSPYLGQVPTTTPNYNNTGSNLLGGAMAGLGLYNQFKQLGTSTAPPQAGGGFSSLYPSTGY